MTGSDSLAQLQAENARLVALLEAHHIEWRQKEVLSPILLSVTEIPAQYLRTQDKLELFKRLFRGRTDVFPLRWESKSGRPDIRQPVLMNGVQVFVRNRKSSVLSATIAN